jgi:23S rRNA (adenine2503-C2)-methyltransferase
MEKKDITGFTLAEIEVEVQLLGYSAALAKDISAWIYRRGCKSFFDMEGIPFDLRRKLDERFALTNTLPVKFQESKDGTKKYLFKTIQRNPFESAYMPGVKRNTLCISIQSGCRMGCGFCYTGALGLRENLTTSQIVGQLIAIPEREKINRLVIMGMGEPLDNPDPLFKSFEILNAHWGLAFGAANITLSTVGILPMLGKLIDSRSCNVAISLHSPFPEQRKKLIPVEAEFPIHGIIDFLGQNPLKKPLRLSFEYVILPGINNSIDHAAETVNLLANLSCHVNVIPLNTPKEISNNQEFAREFQRKLNSLGQPATLRISRGNDIDAACGMMAGGD